ncbi:MAG TPA: YuiB family protein [Bacillota bacterium]|nr:YuiB family protein [Bacillota bacterium]
MLQLVISSILYFVMFFGLAFILNMLLRRTWLMSIFYPIIMFLVIGGQNIFKYFTSPSDTFSAAIANIEKINYIDVIVIGAGFIGTIVSGIVIKILRRRGYQMF